MSFYKGFILTNKGLTTVVLRLLMATDYIKI